MDKTKKKKNLIGPEKNSFRPNQIIGDHKICSHYRRPSKKGRYWDYESTIWMRYLLQVCCPRKPIYTPQNFNEDGEHYFACDKQDPQPCPIGTKCVLGKQCGVKGM